MAILEQMTFIHSQQICWGRRLSQNRLALFLELGVCWQELGFLSELRLCWQERKTTPRTVLSMSLLQGGWEIPLFFQRPLGANTAIIFVRTFLPYSQDHFTCLLSGFFWWVRKISYSLEAVAPQSRELMGRMWNDVPAPCGCPRLWVSQVVLA